MMDELLNSYLEDLRDNLIVFNEAVMILDSESGNRDALNGLFRAAHTIKGNSASMGFTRLEKIVHSAEDLLHEVREGHKEMTYELIQLMYGLHDYLEDCLHSIENTETDGDADPGNLLDQLQVQLHGKVAPTPQSTKVIAAPELELATTTIPRSDEVTGEEHLASISLELLDEDTFSFLYEHLMRGSHLFHIKYLFNSDCMMRTVRSWMLFDTMKTYGHVVFSKPAVPTEEEFKSDSYHVTTDCIELIMLVESDAEGFVQAAGQISELNLDWQSEITIDQLKESYMLRTAAMGLVTLISQLDVLLIDYEHVQSPKEWFDKCINVLDEGLMYMDREVVGDFAVVFERLKELFINLQNLNRSIHNEIEHLLGLTGTAKRLFIENMPASRKQLLVELKMLFDDINGRIFSQHDRLGDILIREGDLTTKELDDIVTLQKSKYPDYKLGQVAIAENIVSSEKVNSALKRQKEPKQDLAQKSNDDKGIVRVPVHKVDNLIDMLAELFILNSQLELTAERDSSDKVDKSQTSNFDVAVGRMAKITKDIQKLSMSLRLVDVKSLFHRLARIVRETGNEVNKRVSVELEGEETQIDRSAVERLFDPLMHIVRNAVSHGIESEKDRLKVGKESSGTVTIRAYSKRNSVYIEVQDDGAGINHERVLAKAKKVGLVDENAEMSKEEIIKLIFRPGFSTQEEINNIAGRGVGMNVVESELKKLGGKVDIVTRIGEGSTFIIRIPMNLAVINGTIIELNNERYVLPTLFIKEFFIMEPDLWLMMHGEKRGVKVRNEIIPTIMPESVFGPDYTMNHRTVNQVIILEMEKEYLAFPVDRIAGRQEIVTKPLGDQFSHLDFAAGSCILGDGKVAVILDVESIFKIAERKMRSDYEG